MSHFNLQNYQLHILIIIIIIIFKKITQGKKL